MTKFIAFVSMVALIAAGARAGDTGIYVEYWYVGAPFNNWQPVSGHPSRIAGDDGHPSGSDITISSAGNLFYRIYAVDPANTDIGVITIDGTGTPPNLFIGWDNGLPGQSGGSTPVFHPSSRLAH